MGRVFEKRKYKMFARFDKMAKGFSRIGKDIAIAVKQGGPLPENNPRLRMAIQNAKGLNMPKDRVDAAIKRASTKEEKNFEETIYEGYAPHGVPIIVECATDNPTRTVANIRVHFSKNGGSMGNSGSVPAGVGFRGCDSAPWQIASPPPAAPPAEQGAATVRRT